MKGKTIRIFLADGAPNGVLTAEIINWTGKVIVSPRAQLAELLQRDESRRTGVYCLVGPDPETPVKDRVYFGEGDSVRKRLTSHERDESKDFWTRTVVITSKDENLTKSHVRYLESRLIQVAHAAGRATIANGTAPDVPLLPEPDIADMEFFLEQMQMVLPVLGFTFLQPKPTYTARTNEPESPTFEMSVAGTKAKAIELGGEIIVLQGSTARKEGVPSWTSFRSQRDQLVADGKLADGSDEANYVFTENVAFSSPSAASSVVAARNTNGRITWRIPSSGKTYADWHEERLRDAEQTAGIDDEQD